MGYGYILDILTMYILLLARLFSYQPGFLLVLLAESNIVCLDFILHAFAISSHDGDACPPLAQQQRYIRINFALQERPIS